MSAHLVLDVPPAERAEHLHRLNLEALAHLAVAVEEPEERRPVSRSWDELLAFTRMTSRCLTARQPRKERTMERTPALSADSF